MTYHTISTNWTPDTEPAYGEAAEYAILMLQAVGLDPETLDNEGDAVGDHVQTALTIAFGRCDQLREWVAELGEMPA